MHSWKDAKASDRAHRTPEVMAAWGPMDPLLESMDIAVVEPVRLHAASTESGAGRGTAANAVEAGPSWKC